MRQSIQGVSMTTSHDVTAHHIEQSPDIAGNKPCIVGTRIRVQDVYVWHEINGMNADEIATEYNLSLAQVYAALTYAFDHLDAIRQDIHESEKFIDELQQKYPSKLPKHLKHD
jgi:uncharacterized protein (DUF433 family)